MTAIAEAAAPADVDLKPSAREPELRILPLKQLEESPLNPRTHFDAARLKELADSIRTTGVLQPLVARPKPGAINIYEIAAGHRRFRAAQLAGQRTVPVIVRELSDEAFVELLALENLGRDDLTALEEAAGFAMLQEQAVLSVPAIAAKIGKSKEYVYGRLKLLELETGPKALLADGKMSAGHAILLARLQPAEQEQIAAWYQQRHSLDYPISVRQLNETIDETVRKRKRQEKVNAGVAKLVATGKQFVRISTGYYTQGKVLARDRYSECEAGATGAVPAVVVETGYGEDKRAGETTYVKLKPAPKSPGSRSASSSARPQRDWQREDEIHQRTDELVREQLLPKVTGLDRDLLARVLAMEIENMGRDVEMAADRVLGTETTEAKRQSPAHEKRRFAALATADNTTLGKVLLLLALDDDLYLKRPHPAAICQRFSVDLAALERQAKAELTPAQTSAKAQKAKGKAKTVKRVARA